MSIDFVVACAATDWEHPRPPNPRGTRQCTYLDILDSIGNRAETLQRQLGEQEFRIRMAERGCWERKLLALDVYPKW